MYEYFSLGKNKKIKKIHGIHQLGGRYINEIKLKFKKKTLID